MVSLHYLGIYPFVEISMVYVYEEKRLEMCELRLCNTGKAVK